MEKLKPILLKPVQFAELTGQCKSKVYDGLTTGAIPSVLINGVRRIPYAYLEKLVREAMADGVVAGE